MKPMTLLFATLLLGALNPGQADTKGPQAGEILAHTCAGCHGTEGKLENEAFMPLAGMPTQQFVDTMLDFRAGNRQSTLMGTVANGLNDQQIRDMAAFFVKINREVMP